MSTGNSDKVRDESVAGVSGSATQQSKAAEKARPYAVFDIDGTIFRSSLYLEIVYALAEQGTIKLPEDSSHEKALKAWHQRMKKDSYQAYIETLVDILDNQVKGMKIIDFERAAERVVNEQALFTYVYPRRLIERLRKEGYFLIALSGSQIEMVERFTKHWGFDAWIGQVWEREGDHYNGVIHKTHKGKGKFLDELIAKHDLTNKDSYAIGDTMGDIELLEKAEHAIAFNPARKLAHYAQKQSWDIVVERKSVSYHLVKKDNQHVLVEIE